MGSQALTRVHQVGHHPEHLVPHQHQEDQSRSSHAIGGAPSCLLPDAGTNAHLWVWQGFTRVTVVS